MSLKRLLELARQIVCPAVCVLCGNKANGNLDICENCTATLPALEQSCKQCATPLPIQNNKTLVCGKCLSDPPPFNRTIALFHYQYPVNRLLTALKFQGKLVYAQLLGQLMTRHLQTYYPDVKNLPACIIPMPLHRKRLKERGFNQALELARPIANYFNLALDLNHCQRIKATQPQMLTPAKLRHKNIKNAFYAQPVAVKHVAVIDDIITTGHTMIEICKTLRKAGVEKIDVWACARTGTEAYAD